MWCGNGIPDHYTSTEPGEAVRLHFETNERERGVGFIIEYKEVGKWSQNIILSIFY